MALTAIFTPFSRLPGELRNKIWQELIPCEIEPALFMFKSGLWEQLHFKQDFDWYYGWQYKLLDEVMLTVPLLDVNREARGVAIAWAQKHNLNIRQQEDNEKLVVTRSWSILEDIIYISDYQTIRFADELQNRFGRPAMQAQNSSGSMPPFHLAIPEAVLRTGYLSSIFLESLYQHHICLEVLNIVLDPQPDLSLTTFVRGNGLQHWKVKDAGRGPFVYNSQHNEFVSKHGQGNDDGDGDLNRALEELFKHLKQMGEAILSGTFFEIRIVYAVKE